MITFIYLILYCLSVAGLIYDWRHNWDVELKDLMVFMALSIVPVGIFIALIRIVGNCLPSKVIWRRL